MRQFTDKEKAYIAIRKEIQRVDDEERALQASQQLWKEYGEGSWVHDAQVAAEEARAIREAREAEQDSRWRSRVAHAVADTFIELDPDE